jgi:hypothetical protein
MSRPPHPPWLNHPNNIRWRIQAVKFSIQDYAESVNKSLSVSWVTLG